jgi:uncharacterized protein (TIGR03067 family)
MRLYTMAVLVILTSSAGITLAEDKDIAFKPEKLIGAWKLVSGERQGTAMDKTSTGGIFVFTKDTLIGKNNLGEELSWMSYTLDTKQTPVAMNLTITKNFVGVTSEAIVDLRDGQLRLCYNLDKKGRPKAFATKEDGNNDRHMVFVKSVDPVVIRKEGKAALPDSPKPIDREAVLAKLKANKVSLGGLTIESKDGGPAINLGTGLDGSEANNANDENLRLISQLPEVERVMVYKGKITVDGLAALAALPKLRYLQMYATEVPAAAFAVLPKLKQLKSLSLGNYAVTDEVISYAGQIKGLKSFDQTQSAMTPAGFLKFLNSVESLEQLTLFGDYVDDACMKRIGERKDLKRFWTNSKRITSAGWVHLAGLAKMEDLFVSETNFGDDDSRSLEGMKNLKFLGLNKTKITDAGMPALAALTNLHDFGLDGTKVTDKGMVALKGMTELDNIYVGMTEVTAKGLALLPMKERMQMMRVGKGGMTAKQLDEMMELFPKTQIFDPSGYWTPERVKAAMKELGKDVN